MGRARHPQKTLQATTQSPTECLIRSLVHNRSSAAEVLELHYWSKEPGLLDIIRGIVAMPEHTRAALETFLAMGDSKSAVASLDARGVLQLSSADVARTVALAECAADDEVPRVLN